MCVAAISRPEVSPSWYAINCSSLKCFMIPFPWLWPSRAAQVAAPTFPAICAPREKQYSSPRPNWISAPPRFLQFRNRRNGASQKRCAPRESNCSGHFPSAFAALRFASTARVLVKRPELAAADPAPRHRSSPNSELVGGHFPVCAGASGRWCNSRRCDRPRWQNSPARQTVRVFDKHAKMPPAQFPRRRDGCRSAGTPAEKWWRYGAPRESEKRRDRPQACARWQWRQLPGRSQRFRSFVSLDRFFALRLGPRSRCWLNSRLLNTARHAVAIAWCTKRRKSRGGLKYRIMTVDLRAEPRCVDRYQELKVDSTIHPRADGGDLARCQQIR